MDTTIDQLPALHWETPVTTGSERLERAADQLWRVRNARGGIRGHLRMVADPLGIRYRAERLHLASGAFVLVGEFWNPDDAVAALRH